MNYNLKENEYYLIKQIYKNNNNFNIKMYNTSEEDIKQIVKILAGVVCVYIYNENTNERVDLTEDIGKINNKEDYGKTLTKISFLPFYSKHQKLYIKNAISYDKAINTIMDMKITKRYIVNDEIMYDILKPKSVTTCTVTNNFKAVENNSQKGNLYEEFIGEKYKKKYGNIKYNGIEKGKKDNGIDLIVENEKSIILIQCKNWISNNRFKINQKDIRAFIGDCYTYKIKNNIDKKISMHFIVSDNNLITDSAKYFIKDNSHLKFKIIPFEE